MEKNNYLIINKMNQVKNIKPNYGIWHITSKGTMKAKRKTGIEYIIDKDRLNENWIQHMMGKNWVDMNDFITAYFEALKRAGIKQLNLQVSYV